MQNVSKIIRTFYCPSKVETSCGWHLFPAMVKRQWHASLW